MLVKVCRTGYCVFVYVFLLYCNEPNFESVWVVELVPNVVSDAQNVYRPELDLALHPLTEVLLGDNLAALGRLLPAKLGWADSRWQRSALV